MRRKIEVYYDGECPFCIMWKDRLTVLDPNGEVAYRDISDARVAQDASSRFTPSELKSEMHARMPDGSWRAGYFAVVEIVRQLTFGDFIAPLLLVPPIAEAGNAAYRWLAARRYSLPGGGWGSCGGRCEIHATH